MMAQALGGISRTSAAEMMFELPTLKLSTTARTDLWRCFFEIITTLSLSAIFIGVEHKVGAVPALVSIIHRGAILLYGFDKLPEATLRTILRARLVTPFKNKLQ